MIKLAHQETHRLADQALRAQAAAVKCRVLPANGHSQTRVNRSIRCHKILATIPAPTHEMIHGALSTTLHEVLDLSEIRGDHREILAEPRVLPRRENAVTEVAADVRVTGAVAMQRLRGLLLVGQLHERHRIDLTTSTT